MCCRPNVISVDTDVNAEIAECLSIQLRSQSTKNVIDSVDMHWLVSRKTREVLFKSGFSSVSKYIVGLVLLY